MVDFLNSTIGLHVNGQAEIVENPERVDDPRAERWVRVTVEEAYIHCSKHVPKLAARNKNVQWGTDDKRLKSDRFFLD